MHQVELVDHSFLHLCIRFEHLFALAWHELVQVLFYLMVAVDAALQIIDMCSLLGFTEHA